MKKYFELFDGYEEMVSRWPGTSLYPTDNEVLFAVYTDEDYSGNAICVFEKEGILYEATDSHCSCNGLEDWSPEKTSWEALQIRDYSYRFGGAAREAFKELVDSHINPPKPPVPFNRLSEIE